MDQPLPEPTPALAPDDVQSESPAPADPVRGADSRAEPSDKIVKRLQARIETREPIVAWTRGWVSREMPLHGVLAARTLDFAVLTEHGIFLLNTGFFTRKPRRCVYAGRLDEIFVTRQSRGRGVRLRIASSKGRPLWLELRSRGRSNAFADALAARTRAAPA